MRIIAGEFRGRKLIEPRFDTTRPITDRAKQSLFDVLMPYIGDAHVYDCFCGTGSMGLECLSRGAAHATFFDADRTALAGLKQNIDALRVADRTKVMAGDIFKLAATFDPTAPIDLLFFDPPYKYLREKPEPLQKLMAALRQKISAECLIIFRHDTADELELPGFQREDRRVYGSMTIDLLRALSE
jgi:16S rRNA (guanine966-N2)-methyltransferase